MMTILSVKRSPSRDDDDTDDGDDDDDACCRFRCRFRRWRRLEHPLLRTGSRHGHRSLKRPSCHLSFETLWVGKIIQVERGRLAVRKSGNIASSIAKSAASGKVFARVL